MCLQVWLYVVMLSVEYTTNIEPQSQCLPLQIQIQVSEGLRVFCCQNMKSFAGKFSQKQKEDMFTSIYWLWFNIFFCPLLSSSLRQAKRLLGQIVERCRNGPGFHNDMDGNSTIQEILIPASKVGLVIGKGGDTIKQLQVRTSFQPASSLLCLNSNAPNAPMPPKSPEPLTSIQFITGLFMQVKSQGYWALIVHIH